MKRDLSIEKLKFQENKIAYNIALIAFLVNQVYLVQILDNMGKTYHIGIEIFINLTMYLFLFLGMERIKNHHKNWSLGFIFMGLGFFLRIFYIPMMILRESQALQLLGDENSLIVSKDLQSAAMIAIIAVSLAGVLIIFSGIHGYKQSITIKNYYEQLELNIGGNSNG